MVFSDKLHALMVDQVSDLRRDFWQINLESPLVQWALVLFGIVAMVQQLVLEFVGLRFQVLEEVVLA